MATSSESGKGPAPLVTIGMPTYNREWSLNQVLDGILKLDYDKSRLRICFVDGGSKDQTLAILEGFVNLRREEYAGLEVVSLKSNIPKARNSVLEDSKGSDYVFFLDSDVIAPPDTLARLMEIFDNDPAVGLASIPYDTINAKDRSGFLFNAFDVPRGPHPAYKVAAGLTLISMKAFNKVGYFNEKLDVHEDAEYCFRMRKSGLKVMIDSSIEGTHLRKMTVNTPFYVSLIRNSALTYKVLVSEGSTFHMAKIVSSLFFVASFLWLIVARSASAGAFFLVILAFCLWVNSAAQALDDGISTKLRYRIVVGILFTAATVAISFLAVYEFIFPRPRKP